MQKDAVTRRSEENPPARQRRVCPGFTRAGLPCPLPPLKSGNLCLNHADGADTARSAANAREARERLRRIRNNPSINLLDAVITLHDRTGIQASLDVVARLIFSGRIDMKACKLLLETCRVASRNFDAATATLNGPERQAHQLADYADRVEGLLKTVDPLLAEAAESASEGG